MEAVQPPKVSRTFFVRDATGLVRELSWFDTFLCGFGILNVALGLVQAFAYAPFVFPGSSMAIAFLIALPGAFFIGLLNAGRATGCGSFAGAGGMSVAAK